MKVRWVLALAVVLILAGCSGLSTGDGSPDRTPYGVEDELEPGLEDPENESLEPDPERPAPWLTTLGVDNASVLVDRHYETLEAAADDRTYVVGLRQSWRGENGSEVRKIDGRFVVEAPDRWYRTTNATRSPDSEPTVSKGWAENGLQILRSERPNGAVDYHAISVSSSDPPFEGTVRSILTSASNATVEAETVNATTWYRVTANDSSDGVRNLSFLVREDGFVERLSYASKSEHWQNASASHLRLEFEAPGPASLERPDWFEEGLEETDAELPGNETDDEGTPGGGPDDGSDDEPPDEGSGDEPTDEDTDDEASSNEAQAVEAADRSLE